MSDYPNTYMSTVRATGINPWAELGSFAWADFDWVWRFGHLCTGCGYPRYEGIHGSFSPYGGCV